MKQETVYVCDCVCVCDSGNVQYGTNLNFCMCLNGFQNKFFEKSEKKV